MGDERRRDLVERFLLPHRFVPSLLPFLCLRLPLPLLIPSSSASPTTVTVDYEGLNTRNGNRTVSLGERPYLDPNSTGRREALGLPKFAEW